MRPTRVGVRSGFVLFCLILLLNSTRPLRAQTQVPAAGTSVTVKMIDAVDSGTDPAGKQYRASVANAVNGGNGVRIPQGASATVTLANSASGWTTQLVSLTVNGQPVAVASAPASLSATSNAANAMNSVLHQLGHHVNTPQGATAVATGQRVVLPPGTGLTFVLSQPPAPTSAASTAPPPSAVQPASTPAAPAPVPAPTSTAPSGSSAGGSLTAMYICFSNPPPNASDLNHKTQYLTAAFEVPVNTEGSIPVLEPAFSTYLKTAYHYPSARITCQPIWSVTDAQTAQKKIIQDRDTAKLNVVDTGWRYAQAPVTQGQAGFDPLTAGPGGLDLTQLRLTTYVCTLDVPGGTTIVEPQPYDPQVATRYLSPVFQADWNSAPVSMAYDIFIRNHYVHDLNLSDLSPRCSAQNPAVQTMMHQSAMIGTKLIRHIVPVDFTDTAAQAAATPVAVQSQQPAPTGSNGTAAQGAVPPAAPNQKYVYCLSGGSGPAAYFSDIFAAVPTSPTVGPHSGRNGFPEFSGPFLTFLQSKYGYKSDPSSPPTCRAIYNPNPAGYHAAEATKKAAQDEAKKANQKVVETGWQGQ